LALAVPVLWGIAFTLAKPATEHFPPLLMFAGVYGCVAIVFSVLFAGRFRTPFWSGLVLGSLAGSIQAILIFTGLARLDAGLTVIVLQTQVPISVLADRLINGTRVTTVQLAGVLVAFLGVAVIAGLPAEPPPTVPILLLLAGAAVWATGQALVRRLGRDEAPKLFALIGLHAAPQLLLGSLLLETGQIAALGSATALQWGSALLLTVLGFGIGNLTWYSLMKRIRLAQLAPFLLLMPVVGVIVSAAVLGERLTGVQLMGGAVVLGGLAMVLGIGQRGAAGEKPRTSEPT
jgi:O-acetylserine/cysteine efflux transporter